MTFDPYVNVEDIVVLVINPKNSKFGQLGKLIEHDWREYGVYQVSFPGEPLTQFPDGICKGDPPSPVRIFYRFGDEVGKTFDAKNASISELKKLYQQLKIGNLESLAQKYERLFNEKLP